MIREPREHLNKLKTLKKGTKPDHLRLCLIPRNIFIPSRFHLFCQTTSPRLECRGRCCTFDARVTSRLETTGVLHVQRGLSYHIKNENSNKRLNMKIRRSQVVRDCDDAGFIVCITKKQTLLSILPDCQPRNHQ